MTKDAEPLAELLAKAASGKAANAAEALRQPEPKPTELSKAERLAVMREQLRKRQREHRP